MRSLITEILTFLGCELLLEVDEKFCNLSPKKKKKSEIVWEEREFKSI